jgi:hypothetical protein
MGTVHFASADPNGATLPADYTFQPGDAGVAAFTAGTVLYTAGTWDVTATDTPSAVSGSAYVNVVAATAATFSVMAPAGAAAGTAFNLTISAMDRYGNTATGYTGTVHFTSADPHRATLPADYTFRPGDAGVAAFPAGAVLYTTGTWDVTATDTSSAVSGSAYVNVVAAPAATFSVMAPAGAVAGTAFDVTVFAVDLYGNVDTNYAGTVHFSSADPYGATLPPDYTFQSNNAGMAIFPAGGTLYTAGTWYVTATDTATHISGSASVNVLAGQAVAFQMFAPTSVTSGAPFDITVRAVDRYGNIDTNYRGTVSFRTSDPDPAVVLPSSYIFLDTDAGMVTLSAGATLVTTGDQTIFAEDLANRLTGSATLAINPASHTQAQAFRTDGPPQALSHDHDNSFELAPDGSGSATILFWIYLTSYEGDGTILTVDDDASQIGSSWICYVDNSAQGGTNKILFHGQDHVNDLTQSCTFNATRTVTTSDTSGLSAGWYLGGPGIQQADVYITRILDARHFETNVPVASRGRTSVTFSNQYLPTVLSAVVPSLNAWHLVILTRDETARLISIQMDLGTIVTAALPPDSSANNGAAPFVVDNVQGTPDSGFAGRIGPLAFFQRTLTPTEKYFFANATANSNGELQSNATWDSNAPPPLSGQGNYVHSDGSATTGVKLATPVTMPNYGSSYAGWFKYQGPIGDGLSMFGNSNGNAFVQLLSPTTIQVGNDDGTGPVTFTVPEIASDTWFQMSVVFTSDGKCHVYVNGIESSTGGANLTPDQATTFDEIGRYFDGTGGTNWNGDFYGIQFFADTLSASDIAALAAGNAPAQQPMFRMMMNEGSGATSADNGTGTGGFIGRFYSELNATLWNESTATFPHFYNMTETGSVPRKDSRPLAMDLTVTGVIGSADSIHDLPDTSSPAVSASSSPGVAPSSGGGTVVSSSASAVISSSISSSGSLSASPSVLPSTSRSVWPSASAAAIFSSDDPLPVGMPDRPADRHEQLQPLAGSQTAFVAVAGDGRSLDHLHQEVELAALRSAAIADTGNVRVVHYDQGGPFGFEVGDDLAGVDASLDDLEGDSVAQGLLVLGNPDGAHDALASWLHELVRGNKGAGTFGAVGIVDDGGRAGGIGRRREIR